LKENLAPSLMDTTDASDATKAVSDKEMAAAKAKTKAELAADAKKEAARTAAMNAAKKKAVEDAKKADKPKAAPAKPVLAAPKPDKKGPKPTKGNEFVPRPTENVKKRTGRDDVFVRSEVAPLYLGGEGAMIKYLQKSLKYPVISKENGVKGTVYVQFVVEKDGLVDDVTVLKGVDNLLNAEAKRVVSSMPKWAPGQQNGRAVAVQYVLPVKFDLVE
jgi:TonB family protein